MAPVEELALLDLDRSNKGASKQRRDQINAEINTMRDLLPLPESSRQRLSQLQIMSLSCVYIRKCNTLQKMFRSHRQSTKLDPPSTCDFFQALTGFLLITTREGKLIYISENVTDYLGHSMVDMKTQGNSLYDIVDKRDHGTVQAQLLQAGTELDSGRDIAFFCRMNMSRSLKRQAGFGDVKVMHVKGHFRQFPETEEGGENQHVFMASCTPLITPDLKETLIQNNTMVFKTVHQLDMAFLEITETAEHHLGLKNDEIFQKSWYSMVHPEDIHEAKEKHVQLIRSNHEIGCMMTTRLLRADNSILWVNIVMQVRQTATSQNDDPVIVCVNQIISEQEAYQFKMQRHMFHHPGLGADLWSPMVACAMTSQDQETRWLSQSPAYPLRGQPFPTRGRPGFYTTPNGNQAAVTPAYRDPRDRRGEQMNTPRTCQTETLKAMLKRKIQGPCRPAKVPRPSLHQGSDKKDNFNFDFTQVEEPFVSTLDGFSSGMMSGVAETGHGWPEPVSVIPQASYRVASVSSLPQKNSIMLDHGWLTPPPCSGTSQQEQVVPDMSTLPDSYLTPDPSPASSPDPRGVKVKTEIMDTNEASVTMSSSLSTEVSSIDLLEQLSRLTEAVRPKVEVKVENAPAPTRTTNGRRKELPIMDAFEVDNFFENLGSPSSQSQRASNAETVLDTAKVMMPCDLKEQKALTQQQQHVTRRQQVRRPEPMMDESDFGEIEEFVNNVLLDFKEVPNITGMGSDNKQQPLERQAQVLAHDDGTCIPKIPMSGRGMTAVFSPGSNCSSDLSEEDEDIIDELSNDQIPVKLSVTVTDVTNDFNIQPQMERPLVINAYQQEDELSQLNKLLQSLVPTSGTTPFPEETQ